MGIEKWFEKKDRNMPTSCPIGSFRDEEEVLAKLPEDIAGLRVVESEIDFDYPLQLDVAHLNHGAFGAVSQSMVKLESALRQRVHQNPSEFYDHICLPLMRESIKEASDFFNGTVVLQPNCTIAMKTILQTFDASSKVARLTPIYGATSKLLTHLFPSHITVEPGYFVEDTATIIAKLEASYAENPFNVLVADHVASQTGRALHVSDIAKWCQQKGVISVIDGTQACWFEHDVWPDYYVLSTHKWLGNVKTCAVVRIEENSQIPIPAGISFGYPDPKDQHLWTGMLDYIPYILLAKALRVYRQHGEHMLRKSMETLHQGMKEIGLSPELPLFPLGDDNIRHTMRSGKHPRVMAMIRVHRLEKDLQSALEQYGVYVSVKKIDGFTYLRVSSWVYNSIDDFSLLSDFLQYRIRLDDCIGDTPEMKSARKRLQFLQSLESQLDMEEDLFSQIKVDSFFHRAEILRHPLIFYYGHTAVFFMNKLLLGMYITYEDKIDPELESLCAVGVDEMSWDDLALGAWDQTPQDQKVVQYTRVKNYRARVRSLLRSMILDPKRELELPITPDTIWWVFSMGIEHSRIHVETSSVIMAQLPMEMMNATSDLWPVCTDRLETKEEVPENKLITVKGGSVSAGRPLKGTELYGWDNEFGKGKEVELKDFEVSEMLVSNAEFEEFIQADGFNKREFWSDDGWNWAKDKQYPRFWLHSTGDASCKDKSPKLRTLSQEISMPYNWPVMVNNYEAEAFCNWKSTVLGKKVRLMSHPEWLLLAKRCKSNDYNINFHGGGSSCPVNKYGEKLGIDDEVVFDIRGNVWQHSRSLLTVLPEFQVHPLYDDFTLPTIDGFHNFILGGSWTSIGNCAEIGARYGFRRHFYQFAGIRYVCSDNEDRDAPSKLVEGEAAMALAENYLNFENPVLLDTPPVANAMEVFGTFAAKHIKEGDSVLVLNGSVGRITVELALQSLPSSILHTDPTANTLDAFLYAKQNGNIRFDRIIEGHICKTEEFEFSPEWMEALSRTEVSVKQVDIFRLSSDIIEPQDVVVLDLVQLNKICCSRRGQIPPNLHVLVKPGGILVLQCSVPAGGSAAPPSIAGFEASDTHIDYCHIAQETRRNHRFSHTHCFAFKRLPGAIQSVNPAEYNESPLALKYEHEVEIATYSKFHFGNEDVYGIPNFPAACAKICMDACLKHNVPFNEAMDAGCGPGRLGIELAKHFNFVTSFDYSPKFLDSINDRKCKNITVFQGDAHIINEHPNVKGKKFDLIVGANLVDRMSNPRVWIQNCKEILAENGLFVIFSPFTWMEDFTKEANWLGGYRKDAEVVWSLQGAIREAGPELCVCESPSHVPFAIPNSDGTVNYVYSQCVIFARNSLNKSVGLTNITNSTLSC